MDEQQALEAGNQIGRLLYARLGRANTHQLMLGQTTLSQLGILDDFERLAERATGVRLRETKHPRPEIE